MSSVRTRRAHHPHRTVASLARKQMTAEGGFNAAEGRRKVEVGGGGQRGHEGGHNALRSLIIKKVHANLPKMSQNSVLFLNCSLMMGRGITLTRAPPLTHRSIQEE